MKRRKASSGFTLVELIVAASLSTIVLLGAFSLMSSMVQSEVAGMRNGTVTAWSLAGIGAMNTDIAGASYIAYPSLGSSGDGLIVCTGYSAIASPGPSPGPIPGQAVEVVEYCYTANTIVRYAPAGAACPPPVAAPPTCPPSPTTAVIATGVYRYPNGNPATPPIFGAEAVAPGAKGTHANIVHLQFVVGNPKPGVSAGSNGQTSIAVPQTIPFDTQISLED